MLAVALLAGPAHAGPAGFAFLEVPAGARASGLGGAYASVSRGVESAFWNPAGLAAAHGLEITGAHFELANGLRHSEFAAAGDMLGGGVSGSIRAFYTEPIEQRDALGNVTGTFGSHDLEFSLGYGAALTSGLDFGVSSQVIRERIANTSATTYSFGTGLQWRPAGLQAMRVGVQADHLGPATHYTIDGVQGADVALPSAVQGGVSYTWPLGGMQLLGAAEGRFTTGRSGVAMFGAELASPVGAALRAGFRANDDAQSVSLGVGYVRENLHLDYAWVPYRYELGDTHRVAFTAHF